MIIIKNEMRFLSKMYQEDLLLYKLCCDISKYEGFVLYGAGHVADILLTCLEEKNFFPLYCVVTKLENKKFKNVEVYSFEEKKLELKNNNILTIVAVSDLFEEEILALLKKNNIHNTILASQYISKSMNEKLFENIYKDKDSEWYKLKVKNWYWERNGVMLDEDFFYNETNQENKIIFVVEHLSARVVKIVEELKKHKEVILLINRGNFGNLFFDCITIKYEFYNSIEELIYLIKKNKCRTIHIFTIFTLIYTSYILIKNKSLIGQVVFETYDIIGGFYKCFTNEEYYIEKYCLENADGVSYREYSLEYQTDIMKYDIKGKKIRFYDYCIAKPMNNLLKKTNDELSICYVGFLEAKEDIYIELADKCRENKCHLHIHPSFYDENKYKECIKRDKEDSYFHFHSPVPYDDLINTLTQYDYGIVPARDNLWEDDYDVIQTKYKYIYLAGNKLFDYLEAGLPIVAPFPLKFIQELGEKGAVINWTIGQYDFEYLKKKKDEMKKNVIKVREEYRLGRNINKLIEFYKLI